MKLNTAKQRRRNQNMYARLITKLKMAKQRLCVCVCAIALLRSFDFPAQGQVHLSTTKSLCRFLCVIAQYLSIAVYKYYWCWCWCCCVSFW